MERVIKFSIIGLVLMILLIATVILIFNNVHNKEENITSEEIDSKSFDIVSDTNISKVTVDDVFYNVKNCVQNYINYINDENYEAIYNILDVNYMDENNITLEYLKENISKINANKFIANKINQREKDIDTTIYFVYGKLINDDYTVEDDKAFTVVVNNSQNVFSIIPKSLENEDDYEYNFDIEYDSKNNYNEFVYNVYTEDKILLEYFNYYKQLAVNNSEEAFSLLDDDYKDKRFKNSKELYSEYLSDVDIKNISPNKYMCDIYDEYKDYICIDNNGIYYIFRETAPMEFKLKLDTYTIETEKFINEYNDASDENRVMLNVDKWIKMINNKDYYNAYDVLDNTFRNNNFENLEEFKNYIENNIPDNCTLEVGEQKYLGNSTYTQVVELKNDNENISKTLIVKLEEDRKFVLAFDK